MIKEGIPEEVAFKPFHRMKEQQEILNTPRPLWRGSQGHWVPEGLLSGSGRWTVQVGGSPWLQSSRALSVLPHGLPGLGEL